MTEADITSSPTHEEPFICDYCHKPFSTSKEHYLKPCWGLWVRLKLGNFLIRREDKP